MSLMSIKHKIKTSLPKPLVDAFLAFKTIGSTLPNEDKYLDYVTHKKGIEIGGPSAIFKTTLPLYEKVKDLDSVNFSSDTVWEGAIQSGLNFSYGRGRKGFQFISEATVLSGISDSAYDFVLSSNCLEHVANPLNALLEWKRVIKPHGVLILILPNKASNFDHRRPTTSFEHIVSDFENKIGEDDLTHVDEIMALHDLSRDLFDGNLDEFKARSLNNFQNRTLHHHIFDLALMESMLTYAGFKVIDTAAVKTDFFALAVKEAN